MLQFIILKYVQYTNIGQRVSNIEASSVILCEMNRVGKNQLSIQNETEMGRNVSDMTIKHSKVQNTTTYDNWICHIHVS